MALASAHSVFAVSFVVCAALSGAPGALAEQPPPKPVAGDPTALSGEFWGDWKTTSTSEDFTALKTAVGRADKSAAALAAPNTAIAQRIVNLAIDTPEDAAKVLGEATAASDDAVSANALATVVNMVTSPATREAAAPLVAPEAQERVEAWSANLSTGIRGLPGIYLGDNNGSRATAPAGYTPVAGGSMGCTTRQ